jgi:hypothetical protein
MICFDYFRAFFQGTVAFVFTIAVKTVSLPVVLEPLDWRMSVCR